MATIVTRVGKGSPLTNAEVDNNFTNLNSGKPENNGTGATGSWNINSATATKLQTARTISITGDLTYTSGSFDGSANATGTGTLSDSGVAAGTYPKVTVDAKGRVTSGGTLVAADIPELTLAKIPTSAFKQSVSAATTGNITLSGIQVIDGVQVLGGRVLVRAQTNDAENGIYEVSEGTWARAPDANTASRLAGAIVNVLLGTQGGSTFTNTFKSSDTLGTSPVYWLLSVSTSYYRTNATIVGGNDTTFRSLIGVGARLFANTVYEIEGNFWVSKTAGTTSSFLNFRLVGSGGLVANNLQVHVTSRFGATVTAVEAVDNYGAVSALNTSLALHAASTTAAVGVIIFVKGTISVQVAGTLSPSYGQSAASGGAWTAAIGNYFKVTPIATAGLVDVGGWG
jgi:phage-related tail fiber protein